ncbi:unnamed protein product [Microthlaspi erraticum]|uniref:RRM domain-containing protein n=1 Tax=Microthlaspi erraticum TaxID=1685480 RepID=A0A6D2JW90_9BRAS|nr:unnamed protein product [Microthlaspi erraticum]
MLKHQIVRARSLWRKEEEEEGEPEETERPANYECCFETQDSNGGFDDSGVLVRGFDTSLARNDIKSAVWKHFESGGCEVSRVFVPIECHTSVPLGFAFVDVDDNEKALYLGGCYVGECTFHVVMAGSQKESCCFPNFRGCRDCGTFLIKRRRERRLQSRWERW